MTVPYTFATQSGNVPASELDANFASVANNVSSANTALTAGTVTTNAQPNITSVGTLPSLSVTGNVTANLFVGNITGSIANATYATTAGFASTAGTANSATTATNATTAATANSATTAGTVTTNAQPNITSVGTLTSLSVSGNVTAGNVIATNLSGPVFIANVATGQNLQTSPSGITQLPLFYDNITKSSGGGYNIGNSTAGSNFIAPQAGYYQINASIGVTPSNWANVSSYQSGGLIGIYKNNNPIASGPFIDFKGIVLANGAILEATTSSSTSILVDLNAGDTLNCKLAYLTTAPTNFWNTNTNIIEGYFQACWIRGA